MPEPSDPSSSIHILDKAKRNEIVVVRNNPMIRVSKSKPTKHSWAASLKRVVGGDSFFWMLRARAGFEVQARWKGDNGKVRKETIMTGKEKPLRSGSRLTVLRSGSSGSRLTRSVVFHSSSSGGAELREECRPSIANGSRGSGSGDIGWGAASVERQGPTTNRTTSSSKVVTSSDASRMMMTPTRTDRREGGSRITPGISGRRLSPSSSAAFGAPLTPEHEVESEQQPGQEPEPVPLWESPQMTPLVSNAASSSSTTVDLVDEGMRGEDRTRIHGMEEVRPLDGRCKRKGKGRASSPGAAGAAAAASRGGARAAEDLATAAFRGDGDSEDEGVISDDEAEWSCQKCTLINKGIFLQCDACATQRPTKGYLRPAICPPPSYMDEQAKYWERQSKPKRRRMTKSQQAESGDGATPPVSVRRAASTAAASGPSSRASQTAGDDVHRSGEKCRAGSNDVARGSSLPSSPTLAEAGFWSAPAYSPPGTDEGSGSRRDARGGLDGTKRPRVEGSPSSTAVAEKAEGRTGRRVEGSPCATGLAGKGEEGRGRGRGRQLAVALAREGGLCGRDRERQLVSDAGDDADGDGETELVEATEGETFSAPFIDPSSVTGPVVNPSGPESLERALPVSPARSGVDGAVSKGPGNDPGIDSGPFIDPSSVTGPVVNPSGPESLQSALPVSPARSGVDGAVAKGPGNDPGTDSGPFIDPSSVTGSIVNPSGPESLESALSVSPNRSGVGGAVAKGPGNDPGTDSGPFIDPSSVTGPVVNPSGPENLESALPVSPTRSGVDGAVAKGPGIDPGTDSGHVFEDHGNSEVRSVIQSQREEGKGEEEEAKEDESNLDDLYDYQEYEEAEYDSNASLDY